MRKREEGGKDYNKNIFIVARDQPYSYGKGGLVKIVCLPSGQNKYILS
jgi:hypothetical protein